MKIDRTHRPWLVFSLVLLAVSGGWYWYDITRGPDALHGPSGGSATGITFGIIGSAFMLFAGLFTLRKKVRTWRIGRAKLWLKGHLWLGTLALPMIWLHGGFHHGGIVTSALMWVTYAIVVSGLIGAAIQHALPRVMMRNLPNETVYEQIALARQRLHDEAEDVVAICGPDAGEDLEEWSQRRRADVQDQARRFLITRERGDQLTALLGVAPADGASSMKQFYREQIEPFLRSDHGPSLLSDENRAAALFSQQRSQLPLLLHESLDDLQRICEEGRQLDLQGRLHRWLHGWLFIHIPLALVLLVLAVFHVIVALRYS